MKHAILIIAHKEIEQLKHLVQYFTEDCYVFIHIDKKSNISAEEHKELIKYPQVINIYRKYAVHWGGFTLLKCQLFLLKTAIKSCDADYFHVISGQDYPIKPLSYFLNFFNNWKNKEFLSFVHIPHKNWQNNTYQRYQYYFPYDFIQHRKSEEKLYDQIMKWQIKLKIKRNIPQPFDHLYGGSQWFSITRKAVETLCSYTQKHKAFYRRLRFTFAPEETYFTTVLVNLLPPDRIINDNYRLIRWKNENGNIPANLGKEHFHLLLESKNLFARKLQSPNREELIPLIDQYLLKNQPCSFRPNGSWKYDGLNKYKYDSNVTKTIFNYAKLMQLHNGIDLGCGAGLYTAALRRLGLYFMGYDANPRTPLQSSLLLPEGDTPLGVADITEEIFSKERFDIVLCWDVMPCIPFESIDKVLENISKLVGNTLIMSWDSTYEIKHPEWVDHIKDCFSNKNIRINLFATNYFRKEIKSISKIYIFQIV